MAWAPGMWDGLAWFGPLVLAPFIGSFLGVLVRRLPREEPVILARSACEACGRRLGPRDLVPLASYLMLRGRCRGCGASVPAFHPAIELAAFGVALWAGLVESEAARLWAGCALGWALLTLAWIDWEHLWLPDVLTLPLVPLGLWTTWLLEPRLLAEHAAAAALGYLAFRGLATAYRALRGCEGLGQGDAKLLAVAGAWLGLEALPLVVLMASLVGLGIAALQRLRNRVVTAATPVPFGPGLSLAIWLLWLHGTRLPQP